MQKHNHGSLHATWYKMTSNTSRLGVGGEDWSSTVLVCRFVLHLVGITRSLRLLLFRFLLSHVHTVHRSSDVLVWVCIVFLYNFQQIMHSADAIIH